jgi:orotidine-5'-phosphate decarboxylase
LLDHAGGTVNSSRGILLAWKKDTECIEAAGNKALSLEMMVRAARDGAKSARDELVNAKKELDKSSVPQTGIENV